MYFLLNIEETEWNKDTNKRGNSRRCCRICSVSSRQDSTCLLRTDCEDAGELNERGGKTAGEDFQHITSKLQSRQLWKELILGAAVGTRGRVWVSVGWESRPENVSGRRRCVFVCQHLPPCWACVPAISSWNPSCNHSDVKRRAGDSSSLKTIPAHSFSPYRLLSVLTTAVLC